MSSLDDLWCQECGKSHDGICKKHGALHKVEDAVIPTRARLTLPSSLTLRSSKENDTVVVGVFSRKVIPVRSQFGPIDAPVIFKTKIETKIPKATTVWKKKHAMQKAMETSLTLQNSEALDSNRNNLEATNAKVTQQRRNNLTGAEVAISTIQQQLMSLSNASLAHSVSGDSGVMLLQSGINHHLHVQSNPIHGHATLCQLQQNIQELPAISFASSQGSLVNVTPECLHALHHHYQTYNQHDLTPSEFAMSATNVDQSVAGLLHMATPAAVEAQSTEDLVIVGDSITADVMSDAEIDDSTEPDMSFELKIVTDDGFLEVLDTADEDHANWMIFVRPAKTVKEQNLIAYQEDGNLFFVSFKPIPSNTELKVWYSKEYAKSINKGMLKPEETTREGERKLQCLMCEVKFDEQDEYENHICVGKVKGRRKGRPRKYVKPTKTWRAKLSKSQIRESQEEKDNVTESKLECKIESVVSEIIPTPKRGRGRPRIRPVVTSNEKPANKIDKPTIDKPEQMEAENKPIESIAVHDDIISENDNEINQMQDMDDDEDYEDPFFKDKKLFINEEKQKKKRGPKVSRSPLICTHCGEHFVAEAAFYIHVFEHTGVKPFICEVADCARGFLSKFKLERHRLIHTCPRNHKCPYCDKCFNRKDHLKNHMITHDPNKKVWKCEICGKEYSYSFSYRTHKAFHAADSGETLTCGICKKMYENREQLLFHLKVHTGARAAKNTMEKTHQCFECGKNFFTRKDVKRHMITHTKRKDFLCQYCPQRFGRKDHLTRHLRTSHTGDNQNTIRVRKSTGENGTQSKRRERPIIFTHSMEPTMVPLQISVPTLQQDDIQEQLMGGVTANQTTALLQNLQYVGQLTGLHGSRDIQIPAALYEAALAAQQQEQQQQQPQVSHMATPLSNIQQNFATIHATVPMQYQLNEKGYVVHTGQSESNLSQLQVSPGMDYKTLAQLPNNMYIATANPHTLQQSQQQQVHHIQLQQPGQSQHSLLMANKLNNLSVENSRTNHQQSEYQLSGHTITSMIPLSHAVTNVVPSSSGATGESLNRAAVSNHSQYLTLLNYMETLKFLENLPTNNTIPLQQVQTLNVDLSQSHTAQLVPASVYNTHISGNNILSISQTDLAKGLVTLSHGGTIQLTQQELKHMVSLAQEAAPGHHLSYQQQ